MIFDVEERVKKHDVIPITSGSFKGWFLYVQEKISQKRAKGLIVTEEEKERIEFIKKQNSPDTSDTYENTISADQENENSEN